MSLTFAYETYYLILLQIISIFILLFVNFVIWLKTKKTLLLNTYLVVQGILFLWMTSKIFKTVAPNATLKFVFVVCQYLGVCFLGEAFFIFAFLYARGRLPATKYIVFMTLPCLFFLLALITNSFHSLFYAYFDFWQDSFGPLFYLHQAYNYILILAGIIFCTKDFGRQFGEKHMRALLFAVAIIVPLIANIIYVFGWFKPLFGFEPPCDITPISCNISLMIFALAIFKYKIFDDLRIARRQALALVPDGILLVDTDLRVMDFNDTFKALYDNGCFYGECGFIKRPVSPKELALYQQIDIFPQGLCPGEVTCEAENGRFYRIICSPVVDKGCTCGFSLRFIDLTLKQAIIDKTREKNHELAALNEKLAGQAVMIRNLALTRTRNFIAGEAHDVLGHSIIIVISLLEVARISLGQPDWLCLIGQSQHILQECLQKNAFLGRREEAKVPYGLMERLNKLKEEISPVAVDLEITATGNMDRLTSLQKSIIFKLCRESITNALRHGKADKINIILRMAADNWEVYVIDNGIGCKEIKKGTGLSVMEKRLSEIDGKLSCGSIGGQGFCLQATLPISGCS